MFLYSSSHAISVCNQQSCDNIRFVTSVYLSEMLMVTSVLAASIIGCLLASATICCHTFCILRVSSNYTCINFSILKNYQMNVKRYKQTHTRTGESACVCFSCVCPRAQVCEGVSVYVYTSDHKNASSVSTVDCFYKS